MHITHSALEGTQQVVMAEVMYHMVLTNIYLSAPSSAACTSLTFLNLSRLGCAALLRGGRQLKQLCGTNTQHMSSAIRFVAWQKHTFLFSLGTAAA